jgi:uncharacterized protein involved in exopolysaccharide biosynthesis
MPDAVLAQQVTHRFLTLADDFNLARRQSQAGAERRFVERRLEEVRDSLRDAEMRLQSFLQLNRDFRAPALELAHGRILRDVAREQQLVATLESAYEQARIEEIRDTPVLTVVETPDLPPRPDPRHLALKTVLGLLMGAGAGLLLGAAHAIWRRRREKLG